MKKNENEIWFDRIFLGSYVPVNLQGVVLIIFGPLIVVGLYFLGTWFREFGKSHIGYAPIEFFCYIFSGGALAIIITLFVRHSGRIRK